MKKKNIVLAVVVLLALAILILYTESRNSGEASTSFNKTYFLVNGKQFNFTYIAKNQSEWEQGLMNKSIDNTTTELFAFPTREIYPFWMYDTYSNLDMIWINGTENGGKVVYIVSNVPTCVVASECLTYTPNSLANFVLEAKAGFVQRNNITIGTTISFG